MSMRYFCFSNRYKGVKELVGELYFENILALHIAIEYKVTQERAFAMLDTLLETGTIKERYIKHTDEDIEDMINLRNSGFTLKEIGGMYFISDSSICKLIKKKESRKN